MKPNDTANQDDDGKAWGAPITSARSPPNQPLPKSQRATLLARDAELSLSDSCLRMCASLLQRAPVTSKERALLMPIQERERGCVAPDVGGGGGGGGGRSMGRLGGGVAQVPALPMASEDLVASKESLPIFEKRDAVVAAVNSAQVGILTKIELSKQFSGSNQASTNENSTQVMIITGDTGSGKTTQVAQYILEEAASAGENDFNNILEGMLSTILACDMLAPQVRV